MLLNLRPQSHRIQEGCVSEGEALERYQSVRKTENPKPEGPEELLIGPKNNKALAPYIKVDFLHLFYPFTYQ